MSQPSTVTTQKLQNSFPVSRRTGWLEYLEDRAIIRRCPVAGSSSRLICGLGKTQSGLLVAQNIIAPRTERHGERQTHQHTPTWLLIWPLGHGGLEMMFWPRVTGYFKELCFIPFCRRRDRKGSRPLKTLRCSRIQSSARKGNTASR